MILHTKSPFFILFILFTYVGFAQIDEKEDNNNSIDNKEESSPKKATRKHFGNVSVDFYLPVPSGNKYIGKSHKGEWGHNVRTQAYVYKQIFFGLNIGETYFEVKNTEFIGNYEKSRETNYYFFVGYEFLPLKNFRLGLNASFYGESNFRNTHYTNTGYETNKAYQTDSGRVNVYEMYVDYELNRYLAVYFRYTYRNDKMRIKAPSELKSLFERAQFHNFGVGIKCQFGKANIFGN